MNTNLTPVCPPHRVGANVWDLSCAVCGVRLLDGAVSVEMLVGRIEALVQEPVQATGRIRGNWIEVLEEGDGQLWAYWARPARNFAGYEAVDCLSPEPTGEQLSALLRAELAGLPAETPKPHRAATRPRRKPSRWSRLKRWSRVSAEREFATVALPLVMLWTIPLLVVLGWDGIDAVCSVLF